MNIDVATTDVTQAAPPPSDGAAPRPRRTVRSRRIESVRAIAALAVVVCHTYSTVNGFSFDTLPKRIVLGGGLYGVFIFFALSGYLIFLPFARRDFGEGPRIAVRTYARNRALRLFPLYYVALAIILVVDGGTTGVLWRFGLFAQNFSEPLVAKAVDGPMWSLVVELHFYVLLPVLALVLARVAQRSASRAALILVGLGAISVVLSKADLRPHDVWAYSLPVTFQYFVPGLLLALLHVQVERGNIAWLTRPWARADLWLLASAPIWLLVFWRYSLAPAATVACFLVVGAAALPLRHGRLDSVLDARLLAAIGVVSYSLYIWHVPVLHWLPHPDPGGFHAFLPMLALGLPVCLVVATVSYVVVERTAMRFQRPWVGRRDPARSARRLRYLPEVTILLAAFATRVGVVLATRHMTLGADATDYDRLGRLIADGKGFGTSLLAAGGGPTAFRPPLYPAMLGGIYRATGGSVLAGRLTGAALGVVTVALTGLLAQRLWERRAGLVAAAIVAVYPPLVLASGALMSEALFLPLEMGAVYAAVLFRAGGRHDKRLLLLSGALLGLGVLTRPAGAILVIAVAAIVAPGWRVRLRRRLAAPALLAVTAVAVVTPWLVRDAVRMHTFVPVSNLDAFNIAGVYNAQAASDPPPARGQFRAPVAVPAVAPLFSDPKLDETALANRLRDAGMDYLREHPGYVPQVLFWNTARLFELTGPDLTHTVYAEDYGYSSRAWSNVAFASWFALAVLAAVGATTRLARRAPIGLWLVPVLIVLVTVPLLGHSRFRAPAEPFVAMLAALALVAPRWRRRRDASEPAAAAAAAATTATVDAVQVPAVDRSVRSPE